MTKQEEKVLLGKIAELIESADADGYIRHSFDGIVAMCAENIDNDFWNNMPDRIEYRDRQIAELRENMQKNEKTVAEQYRKMEHEQSALEDNLRKTQEQLESYKTIVHNQSEKIGELSAEICEAADTLSIRTKLLDEKNAEIMRLKAELYDYMKGAKNNG